MRKLAAEAFAADSAAPAAAAAAPAAKEANPVCVAVIPAIKEGKTVATEALATMEVPALAVKVAAKVVKAHASPPFAKASTPLRMQCDTYLVHKPGLVHPIRSFTCLVASRGTRAKYKGDDVCAC